MTNDERNSKFETEFHDKMTTAEQKWQTPNLEGNSKPAPSHSATQVPEIHNGIGATVVGTPAVRSYHLDHLQYLESEAIHVMREVAAEFERPCLLFSGGKDSICLLRLAEKAFRPSDIPMPFLNVDTGHHFPELNEFRDRRAAQLGG